MNNLFADIDQTNIEFIAFLAASSTAKENELIQEAINSTECQFEAQVFPQTIRATNEESGQVFDFSIDNFCNFMLNYGGMACEIAFDLWLSENVEDGELSQWAEAFILAEDAKEEYRGQFMEYKYKVKYQYIKTNPVDRGAAPAPFPQEAPILLQGEQGECEEEPNEIPMFI